MRSVVVLLAASLLGADRPKGADTSSISYELKFLDMEGLTWRSALHTQLAPVARQGPARVWTASREAASRLAEKAAKVVAAPSVTSPPRVPASVFNNSTRKFVGDMIREADGPVDHASFVGYVPRVEDAAEGYSAVVSGRALDQGVLVTLTVEDRQITAVHAVPITEVVEPRAGQKGEKTPVNVTIQVPEYAGTTVSGEWLIPKDGVLVVSLGVHTGADAKGKAVARERLIVVEAEAVAGPLGTLTANTLNLNLPRFLGVTNSAPDLAFPMPLNAPALPGRSLPRALNADGQPVPLPPLPDVPGPVTMFPGTFEPCATSQNPAPAVAGDPIPLRRSELRDNQMNRAGYIPAPAPAPAPSNFPAPAPPLVPVPDAKNAKTGSADPVPIPFCCEADLEEQEAALEAPTDGSKMFRFSLPWNMNVEIKVGENEKTAGPSQLGVRY